MTNELFSQLEETLRKRRDLNQDFEKNLQRKVSIDEVSIVTRRVPFTFAVHRNLEGKTENECKMVDLVAFNFIKNARKINPDKTII